MTILHLTKNADGLLAVWYTAELQSMIAKNFNETAIDLVLTPEQEKQISP